MGGSTTSVEQEAELLKAALRGVLEQDPGPRRERREEGAEGAHAAWDGRDRDGRRHPHPEPGDSPGGAESCPLCRANRLVHQVAPDVLDEVGRGLDAVGRLLQDLATTVRRHTAEDHPIHRSEREDA